MKHGCMYPEIKKLGIRQSLAGLAGNDNTYYSADAVIGIVKAVEATQSKKISITKIETNDKKHIFLLVKNNAVFLSGELVLYRPSEKELTLFLREAYCQYSVIMELSSLPSTTADNIFDCPECGQKFSSHELEKHLKSHFSSWPYWG